MSASLNIAEIIRTYHFSLKLLGPGGLHQKLHRISRRTIKVTQSDILAQSIVFEPEVLKVTNLSVESRYVFLF